MDVAMIQSWKDFHDFCTFVKDSKHETIIVDPIGELMDKLKRDMIAKGDTKLVQKDGSPTMSGWGYLKTTLRQYLKALRDLGKHVIIVAHLEESKDEDRVLKRPKIETKLSDELVNMVDIVAYMTVVQQEGETKRILIVDPGNDKYTAKDRTGQLGKIIEPDFSKIINAVQGTETYSWSAIKAPKQPQIEVKPAEVVKDTKEVPTTPQNAPQEEAPIAGDIDVDAVAEELQDFAKAVGGTVKSDVQKKLNAKV